MPEVTAKAKSAIYHLKTALSGLEKAEVHLIQARTALPKNAEEDRKAVHLVSQALEHFKEMTEATIVMITTNHPADGKEE